jgi:20S proteasome alpha/beta subunit
MTYVFGAKCTDGVVLVYDTKITTHYGNDDSYDDKITGEIPSVLTALSGSREPFEEFRMRLWEFVRERVNKADKISMDKLLINIGHILDYLDKHYNNYPFDLLVGKTTNPSILYYFYQDGRLEPVTNYNPCTIAVPITYCSMRQ